VLASVDAIPTIPPEVWRGELGYLAVKSPTVHRLSLDMTDRQADAIADAIHDTTPVLTAVAKLQGIAIARCIRSSSATPGVAPTKADRKRQSPTSCAPSSKPSSMNWTAGSVSPNPRQRSSAHRRGMIRCRQE